MNRIDKDKILEALNNHGVIAFPTETVMGLGVYYDDFKAYEKLNKIKERPENKPYTLMVKSIDEIEKYAYLNSRDKSLIKRFMPGAITVLLNVKENVPSYVTHNTNIIGIRVPDYEIATEILNISNKPLLVPSANKSGNKPCVTYQEVKEIFHNQLDYIVEINSLNSSPSTIVDLSGDDIKLIREGNLKFKEIEDFIKNGN